MAEVNVLLADGFEEIEALAVVDVLRRGDVSVLMLSMNDSLTVTGSRGIKVIADALFDATLLNDSKLVVLPGGAIGTQNLSNDSRVLDILPKLAETHYIAAICAAPSVLAKIGLLESKSVTSNPNFKEHVLKNSVNYLDNAVVIDGSIITSRSMGTSIPFALEILEILRDIAVRSSVEEGMVWSSLVDYVRANYQ